MLRGCHACRMRYDDITRKLYEKVTRKLLPWNLAIMRRVAWVRLRQLRLVYGAMATKQRRANLLTL